MGARRDPSQYVAVETLAEPTDYSPRQIELALGVAYWLNRGKLILCEPPHG
jgi:hypothetical protein